MGRCSLYQESIKLKMKKFRGTQENQGYSTTFYENLNCSEKPEVSVIMPVFQQEKIIYRNLNSIYKSMSMFWELILIEDAGKDRTKNEILRWIKDLSPMGGRLLKIVFVKNVKELYETKCDILGFKNAQSKYLLEIQSDMEITEVAFDRKLVQALESHTDILMISGRGTHSFDEAFKELILVSRRFTEVKFIFKQIFVWLIKDSKFEHLIKLLLKSESINSKAEEFATGDNYHESIITPNLENFISTKGKAGRLGPLITTEYSSTQIQARNIWLGETVMRGPLIIRRDLYEQLGGFDSSCFYLGFDDHDLSLRGYKYLNVRTGFVPVGFKSPPQDSTVKKKKILIGLLKYLLIGHNFYANINKSELYQLGKNLKPIAPQLEIRDF